MKKLCLFCFFDNYSIISTDEEQITSTPIIVTSSRTTTSASVTITPSTMDHDEKRMRRQIANSNERRRMQSINAGFQSLRNLLPHHEGEKLSKV